MNANEKPQQSLTETQAENVQEAAEQVIDYCGNQASNLIRKHVMLVLGASLVPVPLFDLLALNSKGTNG